MKCKCDPHIEYCDICFPPENRRSIVKPRNGKPLTDAEIDALADAIPVDTIESTVSTWHLKLARAIERAHGIGD